MGRAKNEISAIATPFRGREKREETGEIQLTVATLSAGLRMAESEDEARAELKRRFNEYVDFSTPTAINKHLELLIEGLSDEVYDFGRTKQERAVFKEMLTDLKALNQDLEDIAGISHFEAAEKERLQAAAEGRIRHAVKVIKNKSKEIKHRVPHGSEMWGLTWATPVARMHMASVQRQTGELTRSQYIKRLNMETSVGVVNSFKTLWHFTGALRGFNGAIKVAAVTAAAANTTHLDTQDAVRMGVAAGAVVLVSAGVWTELLRRRRRARKIEHELMVNPPAPPQT